MHMKTEDMMSDRTRAAALELFAALAADPSTTYSIDVSRHQGSVQGKGTLPGDVSQDGSHDWTEAESDSGGVRFVFHAHTKTGAAK